MSLFLDRHDGLDATAAEVAEAHVADLEIQQNYGVTYLTYWYDPGAGTAFCLVDAPDAEAADRVHRESHGLVANRIVPVDEDAVHAFLGRIGDPAGGEPIAEPGLRTILFTDIVDSTALTQRLGDDGAMELVGVHDATVRLALHNLGGSEVKHTGDGILASFASVRRAAECSITVQRGLAEHNAAAAVPVEVRIGLNAGEPVALHDDLFGTAVQLASRLCDAATPGEVLTSGAVRDLAAGKNYVFEPRGEIPLKGFDEPIRAFALVW